MHVAGENKDTDIERFIRSELHKRGYRFRKHVKTLPGTPDIVFPKFKAVIFINGCFWHGHDCHLFKIPETRTRFWMEKIDKNRARDLKSYYSLKSQGWKVIIIWECAIRGRKSWPETKLIDHISEVIILTGTVQTDLKYYI